MKFIKTNYKEQETQINIPYCESILEVYTSRKTTFEKLKSKLGEPSKIYITNNQISGGLWEIPFEDKKRLNYALSRPLLIGSIK